jgi:hypothetical protein
MRMQVLVYALTGLAMFVFGPLAFVLASSINDPSGGKGTSILLSSSLVLSLAKCMGMFGIAGVLAALSAKLVSLRAGLFNAGIVMWWAAAGLGNMQAIFRTDPNIAGNMLVTLALEAGVLMVLTLAMVVVASKMAKPEVVAEGSPVLDAPEPTLADAALCAALCAGACVIGVFLAAQSAAINQVLASGVLGAAIGATVAGVIRLRAPMWSLVAGVMLVAIVAPLWARSMVGPRVFESLINGTFPAIARVTPMAYVAGALVGTPMGMMWARGLSDRRKAKAVSA